MRRLAEVGHLPLACLALLATPALTSGCKSKSPCVERGVVATLEGGHPHEVDIPSQRVARAAGGTYPLKGQSGHDHVIHLTDGEMSQLEDGRPVTTRASSVNAHTHEVVLSCRE